MEARAPASVQMWRWPSAAFSTVLPIRFSSFARPRFRRCVTRPGNDAAVETGSLGVKRLKTIFAAQSSGTRRNDLLKTWNSHRTTELRVGINKQFSSNSSGSGRRQVAQLDAVNIGASGCGILIADGKLLVNGNTVLRDVPDNVTVSASDASEIGLDSGAFIGANFSEKNSRHVVPLGVFRGARFLSLFRFKLWWMAQRMGNSGREIPIETQFLLTEINNNNASSAYAVFLPLLEGAFRMSLQGNDKDQLELVFESGDPAVTESRFKQSLLINYGADPFRVLTNAVKALEARLQTFRHRENKKIPGIVDWFGWCTWDAFYTDVSAKGVEEGLKSLSGGGTPPRFVIIDDGWQSVSPDEVSDSKQNMWRLTNIKENYKFEKDEKHGDKQDITTTGIRHIVEIAKNIYNLKYVYVWHAITGYWGGVKPDACATKNYDSQVRYPVPSPGVVNNEPGMQTDLLTTQGIGLVSPNKVFEFYNDLHSYLAEAGIDGVKVDVQCILETLGAGLGGRVALTNLYHQSLDSSTAVHFPDNGCIACMSHNTDALYRSKQTAVVRASDDFYPRDPVTHTIHIASVAFNSLFLGEFMLPDWDMFHSVHPAAEYHAAARAVGGCPIYVSDKPGRHDFQLLKKLILPDGSILRARLPGRPTVDCLLADPTRDGKSLLKIWNMNKYTGVLGVFNCQGAAWSNADKKNVFHDIPPDSISGCIRGQDVHLLAEAAHDDDDWDGDCAVYSHSGDLVCLSKGLNLPVSLKVLEHEVYTITPIKKLAAGISFAPIGLTDMFNSGGAVRSLEYVSEDKDVGNDFEAKGTVIMEICGCGRMGAYSSVKPENCYVSFSPVDFTYENSTGLLTLVLPMTTVEGVTWTVTVQF